MTAPLGALRLVVGRDFEVLGGAGAAGGDALGEPPGRCNRLRGGGPVASLELDVEDDVVGKGARVDHRLPRYVPPAHRQVQVAVAEGELLSDAVRPDRVGKAEIVVDVEVPGIRRQRRDLGDQVVAGEGPLEIGVAEVEGRDHPWMADRRQLRREPRRPRRIDAPVVAAEEVLDADEQSKFFGQFSRPRQPLALPAIGILDRRYLLVRHHPGVDHIMDRAECRRRLHRGLEDGEVARRPPFPNCLTIIINWVE